MENEIEEQEIEEQQTGDRLKAKAGATLFSFTGWMILGGLAGTILGNLIKGYEYQEGKFPIGFLILIPFVIALLQRTSSDKLVTWYKWEARISGFALAALAAFIWS